MATITFQFDDHPSLTLRVGKAEIDELRMYAHTPSLVGTYQLPDDADGKLDGLPEYHGEYRIREVTAADGAPASWFAGSDDAYVARLVRSDSWMLTSQLRSRP